MVFLIAIFPYDLKFLTNFHQQQKKKVFWPNPPLILIFGSKQTHFSLVKKCTVSIFSLHFWLSFVPFAYSLSTHCSRSLRSIKLTRKRIIHFSLKCFSHIPLKYSTSCSNYCSLKPRVGKIHCCPANGFFYKQRAQSLYLRFSHCCNAWRKSCVGYEKEDIWKPCKSQHTHVVMEQSWNIALCIEMLL